MITFGEHETSTFSELVRLIYTTPVSKEAMREMLLQLQQLIPADVSVGIAGAFYESVVIGGDESVLAKYKDLFNSGDPVAIEAVRQGITICRPQDLLGKEAWERSELGGYLAANGLHHILTIASDPSPMPSVRLHLARTDKGSPFTDREMHILKLLQPHLADACKKFALGRTSEQIVNCIDRFHRPIFLFGKDFTPLYMNRSAEKLCERIDKDPQRGFAVIRKYLSMKTDAGKAAESGPMALSCSLEGWRGVIEVSPVTSTGGDCRWIAMTVCLSDHFRSVIDKSRITHGLTRREVDICMRLAEGLTNKQIAEQLFITEFTVKDHVKSILEKLGASSRNEITTKLLGYWE